MNEYFWSTVKRLLKEKGITQVDFAKSLGIQVRTFQDWSTSKRLPDVETCCTIADALDVSVDYLLRAENKGYVVLRKDQEEVLEIYEQIPSQFRSLAVNALKALEPLKYKVKE